MTQKDSNNSMASMSKITIWDEVNGKMVTGYVGEITQTYFVLMDEHNQPLGKFDKSFLRISEPKKPKVDWAKLPKKEWVKCMIIWVVFLTFARYFLIPSPYTWLSFIGYFVLGYYTINLSIGIYYLLKPKR